MLLSLRFSQLNKALLRETQESGEESPPAFRPTQNTSNPSSAQHRRRRSRKESSGPFSHPTTGTPPSVQSNTVAGNNRKGGSLQNISLHSQRLCLIVSSAFNFFAHFHCLAVNGAVCDVESGMILQTVERV